MGYIHKPLSEQHEMYKRQPLHVVENRAVSFTFTCDIIMYGIAIINYLL